MIMTINRCANPGLGLAVAASRIRFLPRDSSIVPNRTVPSVQKRSVGRKQMVLPKRRKEGADRGFTLIEMVMVMVITGLIAAVVAKFITLPVQGYFDSAARAELTDVADTALRRITRDLRLALPNSVRVTNAGGTVYLEFLLTKTGARYLGDDESPNTGTNPLSFTNNATLNFDVVGNGLMPTGIQTIVPGDSIVVYNLGPGQDPADAYNCVGAPVVCNRATVGAVAANTITLLTNPFANQPAAQQMRSPGHHFHVVNTPVTYACTPGATGTLRRYWNYAIQTTQPANVSASPLSGATTALLASGVTACNFDYINLPNLHSALVGLQLSLEHVNANSGTVTLNHQVHVDNTP